ncbi:MAG: hypothetical protein WC420_04270 [Candidatus Paceibacterota bacterium]|jgi:predicted RNase H-like nuclease (RuvC/YqgF family)
MGNTGLEPEITREFLEKEYRDACKTIAELTEKLENAEKVCSYLKSELAKNNWKEFQK